MKIGELFFVLGIGIGVGNMMVSELRMWFELAWCCNIFEYVKNACGVR